MKEIETRNGVLISKYQRAICPDPLCMLQIVFKDNKEFIFKHGVAR